MERYFVKTSAQAAAAELEAFHIQRGGVRLLPELQRVPTQSDLIEYWLIDDDMKASLLIKPLSVNDCEIVVEVNESHRWGWMLGVPGRSELGVSTYVASDTSPRCSAFCSDFITHISQLGYIGPSTQQRKGGRPRDEDYEWARAEIHTRGRDEVSVFQEWVDRVGKERVNQLGNAWESFKKAVSKPPRSE